MKQDPYQVITDRIVEMLEAGTVPWRKPWNGPGGQPQNLKSKKAYRGINVFVLNCSPYSSPYWLTYKQAKAGGGSVNKGECGTKVIFWKWLERKEESDDGETSTKRFPILRMYTVFNVEQCTLPEGKIPETSDTIEHEHDPVDAAEEIIAAFIEDGPELVHDGANGAWYRPATDTVNVPLSKYFANVDEYYSTIFHELGHSTGHANRLNRPGIAQQAHFGSEKYGREELIAEMTAAFLSGHTGIDNSTIENSAAYLASWIKQIKKDSKLIVTAAAQAQKAADLICGVTY